MDVIWRDKPVLRRPRALVAFEGWNDACDAASGAVTYLLEQNEDAEPFAMVDPEEFYDFQEHRPVVEIDHGGTRQLHWPFTRFYVIRGSARDTVLVLGEEPTYRWKTFCRMITQAFHDVDVEDAVLLGAFIGQVAHTLPVPVMGVATDPARIHELDVMPSRYEGPTGIIGVMLEACREAGVPALSLWAATPHYLAANSSPTAMLALLRAVVEAWGEDFDLTELERASNEFDRRVEDAMNRSGELAEYITELEASNQRDPADPRLLVDEIEAFLKEQG